MKDNLPPDSRIGAVPVASPIAIRIVKMLCPINSDTQTHAEALKVDEIMQMGAINAALARMKAHASYMQAQFTESQKRLAQAGEIIQKHADAVVNTFPGEFMVELHRMDERTMEELQKLVWAMNEYIEFLHDAEKRYVLPHFLKEDNPIKIFPDEVLARAKALREKVASLAPQWLLESDPAFGRKDPAKP